MIQRVDEGGDIVGLVDGHDLVTLFVVGGVERQGELEFYLVITELADHLGDAGGGDGDAAGAHGEAVIRVGDPFDSLEDILIIQQGFAHAHEDDIRQFLPIHPFGLLVDQYDFVIDLVVVKVTLTFHVPCGAELTAQRAADLRGDAGCFAFIGRDEYAFDHMVVHGAETAFDRAVGAVLGGVDLESGEREFSVS
jgi:hypothetical protein